MNEPRWVSLDTAIAVHDRSIMLFGGSDGVRDLGLLESALARPRNVLAYAPDAPLFRLAAAYGHGISSNHPFIDGNKRTAFAVTGLFLAKNGLWLSTSEVEAAGIMVGLAASELTELELAEWLSRCVVALKGP